MAAETFFRAMGTDVHIVAVGATVDALSRARREIDRLERMWSRFIAGSEIDRLNAGAGDPVRVSDETISLVSLAVEAWRATAGLFDPTILRSLETTGYDKSFELLEAVDEPAGATSPAPGCGDIVVNLDASEITLPAGVAFDPGGIGKGYAADLVAERMVAAGDARGVCVNLGGDLRAVGEGAEDGLWLVDVEHPVDGGRIARIAVLEGAVATTTHARRRWSRGDRTHHHLIDPRTGGSAWTGVAAVTVVAGDAWWADVLAKAAFLAGADEARSFLGELETPALLVEDDGTVHAVAGMEAWVS